MLRINKICLLVFLAVFCSGSKRQKPNIVLFLTDDQDILLDGMTPMNKTRRLLTNEGTTFTNAFTGTPVCCPSRASILTGLYQHNHQTFNNTYEGGCYGQKWRDNHEKNSFAVHLQRQGYVTYYGGKYLNMYGSEHAGSKGEVPPGWDHWIGLHGNSKYYNYTLSINGENKHFKNQYLTTMLKYYSLSFLNEHDKTKPFLMVVAPPAPHSPFTPEPKYNNFFKGIKVPRTIQFNYANNTNKHWLVRMGPSPLPQNVIDNIDTYYARRWETLLSVDDLVAAIFRKLKKIELLEDTYIIFTSDNGYHLGQFSMPWDKRQMYEFDTRVPFVVKGPTVPRGYTEISPVMLQDLWPTLLQIGGLFNFSSDGKSFLPIQKLPTNRSFLIEYRGEIDTKEREDCWPGQKGLYRCSLEASCKCEDSLNNTYTCLREISQKNDYIYCTFKDNNGFQEAYDFTNDPFQLHNIANRIRPRCKSRIKKLIKKMEENCGVNQLFFHRHSSFHKCYM